MFKANNKDTRATRFIVNFEHILHLALVFLLLTLKNAFYYSICFRILPKKFK